MKFKKLAALVLAGALCLTSLVGCGVKADETAATLGDQKITAGVVNFICKYVKIAYDDTYVGLLGEDFWSQDLYGYGTTMEEDIKEYMMDYVHELYTMKAHMADYNVEITADEEAAIKKAAAAFLAANTPEAIEEMGATEEIVAEMLTLYTINAKMYEVIGATADHNVTDEEANMRGITIVEIDLQGEYNDKGTYVKYTDEQVKAVKLKAEKINTEMASVGLKETAKQNGYTASETAYSTTDTSIDSTLLKAMNAKKAGESTGIVETKTAMYIVTIDEETDKEATEDNREAIIAERESKRVQEELTKWQKDDGWKVNESVVNRIEFHNILTAVDPNKKDTEKTESTESTQSTEKTESTESK